MPSPEPDYKKVIGDTIRKLKTEADLSLAELAERSGVSASWLSRLESGKHESTWEGLEEVAKGLGLSLSQFAAEIERMEKKGR